MLGTLKRAHLWLKKFFGENYPLKASLLSIACAWPAIVFYEDISFDKAKFTTLWLRCSVTGVVLFYILKARDQYVLDKRVERTEDKGLFRLMNSINTLIGFLQTNAGCKLTPNEINNAHIILSQIDKSVSWLKTNESKVPEIDLLNLDRSLRSIKVSFAARRIAEENCHRLVDDLKDISKTINGLIHAEE